MAERNSKSRRSVGDSTRYNAARNSANSDNGRYYKSVTHTGNPSENTDIRGRKRSQRVGVRVTAKNIIRVGETKIRLGAFDYQFLLITVVLIAFGMVMLYSASSSSAYAAKEGDSLFYVRNQFKGLCVGIVAMIFFMAVDYHVIAKLSPALYAAGIIMLILVLIPGVGTTSNGATRWLFGFQPSEIVKLAAVLVVALYLDRYRNNLPSFFKGFVPCLLIVGAVGCLLMMEPHFSATILIVLTTLLMMFAAGAKIKHFLILGVPAVLGGAVLIFTSDYRMQRVLSFGNPFADKQGSGWQIVQSLYAIGSGGIFGVGFGQSRQKYLSLPEPHNDFIFSVLAEELGWIGVIVVIVLFICLIVRGIRIAQKAPDALGMLIVVGCIGLIGFQALINIGVVSASLPVTGMPLPFFSYGGTALAITMAEIGLILNVSRRERVL